MLPFCLQTPKGKTLRQQCQICPSLAAISKKANALVSTAALCACKSFIRSSLLGCTAAKRVRRTDAYSSSTGVGCPITLTLVPDLFIDAPNEDVFKVSVEYRANCPDEVISDKEVIGTDADIHSAAPIYSVPRRVC